MKKWVMYILFILILALSVFLFAFTQERNKSKKVSEILVEMSTESPQLISAETVNKLLIQNDEGLLNNDKSKINLYQLEQDILSNEYIKDIQVAIQLDDKVIARVKTRMPVARIINDIKSYYIDSEGYNIPLSDLYTERVPLASGINTIAEAKECVEIIKCYTADEFLKEQIIGLRRNTNGDFVLNTRIGKHKVLFGKAKNIEEKFKKLLIFYKKEWNSEVLNNYTMINLKYDKQVVCSS